ncbi:MAG: hypothetical protein ACE5HV_11640 [Acidobacteriota bacterium]
MNSTARIFGLFLAGFCNLAADFSAPEPADGFSTLEPAAGFSAPEPAAAPLGRRSELRLVTEGLGHLDGSIDYRQLVFDETRGRFVPLGQAAHNPLGHPFSHQAAPEDPSFQPLIVKQAVRWETAAPINFRWTRKLRKHRKEITEVLDKFVDKRTGHPGVPKTDGPLGNKKVGIKQLEDPIENRDQKNFSGTNDMVRTDDNQTFFGVPEDVVIRSLRMDRVECTFGKKTIRCTRRTVEGDIHFSSKEKEPSEPNGVARVGFFEDLSLFQRQVFITWAVKSIHGQDSDAWAHHITGTRDEITPAALKKKSSRTNQESRDYDNALYSVTPQAAPERTRGPKGPRLLPMPGAVIDIGPLEPTFDSTMSLRENIFRQEAFFVTDLAAPDSKNRMTLQIFNGNSTKREDRIISVAGFSVDRIIKFNDGSEGLRDYLLSNVAIGGAGSYKKLKDFVMQNGEAAIVNGISWDHVVDVTAKLKVGAQSVKGQYKLALNEDPVSSNPRRQ